MRTSAFLVPIAQSYADLGGANLSQAVPRHASLNGTHLTNANPFDHAETGTQLVFARLFELMRVNDVVR
jgi:uncharacterized protein YjbI with pentapeptide repeats